MFSCRLFIYFENRLEPTGSTTFIHHFDFKLLDTSDRFSKLINMNNSTKIILSLLLSGIWVAGFTQSIERQLIGSLGIDHTASNFTSSAGETLIQTLSSSGLTLTQGFQQATATEEPPPPPPPPPLGVSDISEELLVYPNPVPINGNLTLEIGLAFDEQLNIDLISLDGKVLLRKENIFQNSELFHLGLKNIPAGQWLLLIHSENYTATRKILITD